MAIKARFQRNALRLVTSRLQRAGQEFQQTMITERLSGPTGPKSLSVRTGTLRRAVKHRVVSTPPKVVLFAFVDSTAPYAQTHEEGATIFPKRSKFLAIPIGKALTRAGVTKAAFRKPREVQGLFPIRTKAGKLLLARKRGKKAGLEFLYVLKSSVVIPPRLGFKKTFKRSAQKALPGIRRDLKKMGVKLSGGGR